jgi:large subunit ribosomal protein L4
MSVTQLSLEGAASANITVISGTTKGNQAVHDLIVAYRANRRTGSACTKTRGEVRGSGKKIYKQKGTGGARHGARSAPIFVGGGVVFGPRPRDYSKKVTKSTRKLALRKALGEKIAAGEVATIASFAIADAKTKSFIAAVNALTDVKKTLIIAKSFDEKTYLSGRNVKGVQLITADEVNIEQILHANAVIIVEDSFEILSKRTA